MGQRKIFKDANGYYTAVIELPPTYTPEGKKQRRRKVIRRKNKQALIAARDEALAERHKRGDLITGAITVEQWFTHWLDQAAREVRPGTMNGYRTVVNRHIVPGLGPKTKLDKITADRIRRVYANMTAAELSSTYLLNAHRVMSSSFEDAVREGRIYSNPTRLVKAPRKAVANLDVLTRDEAVRLLYLMLSHPEGLRWATALLTGGRRGEIIGLEVDRVGDVIDLSWQMQRLTHDHGCGGTCGRRRGGDCPEKRLNVPADYEYRHVSGGLYWTRPKSKAGLRIIPLVEPLRQKLHEHIATMPPNEWGLVFTNDGKPRDPDQDSAAWRDLMQSLFPGRRVRLHDLRHSAVDLMYEAKVPEDLITEIVGHSTRGMSRAYKSKGNLDRLWAGMNQVSDLVQSTRGLPQIEA